MPTVYRFGPFRLDTEASLLFRGNEPVALGRRAVTLLRTLVDRAGSPVSKDVLIEAAWPGLSVEESNLPVQIAAIRRVFEDQPGGHQWIETLPRRGYRFTGPVVTADGVRSAESARPLAPAQLPSVAVLPFDNLSHDPEQEYLADGLAEDLITDLSKISGLSVIARNSAFAFKGQTIDIRRVAEALNVRHVLMGSVRKAGGRVRINAQLVDAASGGHIWAERYDGDLEDIFSLQDTIAGQIVSALQVSLTPGDKALAESKPTGSVEAYDLFLKGRARYYRYTPEDLREAVTCLEEAIAIDPNLAEAYGYLSYCYFTGQSLRWPGYDDGLDRAIELAEQGVALDGTSAIALARLAFIQTFLRRYDEATANAEKALALAPNNADVNATCAQILNFWGDPERGRCLQEKAHSMEIFPPPNWEFHMGVSQFLLQDYDHAIASFSRAVPRFPLAYSVLACAYLESNRLDDANVAIKKLLEYLPQHTVMWIDQKLPFRLHDLRARILDGLRKAGMPEG